MRNTSMILMSDYYKQAHAEQYPDGITKLISYATARMTRMTKEMLGDKLTVFGIQAYVKDFLIERFNETFFNVPLEEAMAEYEMVIGDTFPLQYVDTGKFEALHKLGYLPVEVGCLPEGTRVPIKSAFELPEGQCQVPFMYIVNTHPDFPWVTEFLESVTSSEVWYPMAIANQAYYYRQIVNKWYGVTGIADEARKSAISEFGFRGGKSSDAVIKASSAFLTSFNKTATIPAIKYMHDYYGDPIKESGGGMISTEHSVMCSNYAVDLQNIMDKAIMVKPCDKTWDLKVGDIYYIQGDNKYKVVVPFNAGEDYDCGYVVTEAIGVVDTTHNGTLGVRVINPEGAFLKKLFGELYPTGAVSVVMDTYDYWENLKNCGHGQLKEIIMNRPGTVFFRGDSGDPVDIICGHVVFGDVTVLDKFAKLFSGELTDKERGRLINKLGKDICVENKDTGEYFTYHIEMNGSSKLVSKITEVEVLGTVGLLAEMFGYTVNEAGYKVLDSHVRAIYGDSITPNRAEQMYRRLAEKGFAANNVALGAGSFSTQCAETPDGRLLPFTRDSYGIAVKATWCQDKDGDERQLFKNPKTDTGKFKKSQKGLIYVSLDKNGEIIAREEFTTKDIPDNNMLQPIFRDGKMVNETTLAEIRNRLHNNDF